MVRNTLYILYRLNSLEIIVTGIMALIFSTFVKGPLALEKNLYSAVCRYSMNINYVTLVDSVIQFFHILTDFPSTHSVNF